MSRILYLGLDPSRYPANGELVHLPLIQIVPRPFEKKAFQHFEKSTHLLFTSRTAVSLLMDHISLENLKKKLFIAVGEATASLLLEGGLTPHFVAEKACGEGVVELLENFDTRSLSLFYPHSSLARNIINNYLKTRQISHFTFSLYDTKAIHCPLPSLDSFDKIVFTSPSVVAAFAALCPILPPFEKCVSIGPITQLSLNRLY